ncbi:MAG: NADH-quinone oxidoreductase subunit NuoH [Gemmatimonadaceae bacterium]|nr:NADH-quinone oxidoreductase subunit NuoH [Gemmatimonadaceae bacterium]NUO94105.1 NADH-quinone oxidoreductase subunit NuoH [Gemmatimonadaceae bacterium]NUP55638.1 NADH-quinone oxidoreductase subunit NuoH [Gemmatimonadaceae bacterium]NUP72864.1 NADH-quinone oxidoreductase subunit NuoH [Gemmatimonadaceae bacterium]NUR35668.1 NADH-quinone oxidoreductase subunit NuoH [Gemmatimonadaceae bacterium]
MTPTYALLQITGPTTEPHFGFWLLATVLKMLAIFTVYMLGAALLTLAERKISAWMQDRHGPNRVGKGWLQPIADGVKNFVKEETYPDAANLPLFILAPVISFIPALITWAVIPFAAPWGSRWGIVEMVLAPLPIGFLFILAISSLGVYGIVLAGWSSNNKYALLGSIRSSAQMVSYEIAMGMSTIPVLLLAGNVSLSQIVNQQAFETWNVINLTVAFFIFLVAAFAETNRLPFDLPEAESELITGYHTEYSAMKFSLFFIAEYCNMITASALMATLFFGGWDIPFTLWDNVAPHTGLKTLLTLGAFATKTLFFLFLFMWIRWTLPRFRYDQLMSLGWRFMLPLALTYIVAVAALLVVLQGLGFAQGSWPFHLGLAMLNIVAVIVLFMILDRGRVISPASSRLQQADIVRLRAVAGSRHAPSLLPETGD